MNVEQNYSLERILITMGIFCAVSIVLAVMGYLS